MSDGTDSPEGAVPPTSSTARGSQTRVRFKAIVADADEGVVVVEPNGAIGYANAAAEFLLGQSQAELTGEMFGLPATANDQAITVNVVSRDAVLRLVELRIEPLAAAPKGTLLLRLRDVTAFHRTVSQARDEVRRRDEFLAMLSHELRNPLAAIRTAAVLLADDALDSQCRSEASAVLDRQFGHLTRILDDLLDITRILRGRVGINPGWVDLNRVLHDAAEAIAPFARERRHHLHVDIPKRRLWIWGDATRLEQVVVNLLNNAVKFTPAAGNIVLRVSATDDAVEICVRDNGPGIPADLRPRIFEPFVQGAQTLERSHGGLGIGLMLVKTFVTLHGGSIDAHSNADGPGTSFAVRLPVILKEPHSLPESKEEPVARPLQVLLVEDNDDARRMLKLLLKTRGHEVLEAANGPDGLDAALERRPDVALVDIGLPGMDGYEVARRLRRETAGRRPQLVALTGYGTPEDVQAAIEAGFDDHMVKPVHFPDLCRIIDRHREGSDSSLDGGA